MDNYFRRLFKWKLYIKKNPDLRIIKSVGLAWAHWKTYGCNENRTGAFVTRQLEQQYMQCKNLHVKEYAKKHNLPLQNVEHIQRHYIANGFNNRHVEPHRIAPQPIIVKPETSSSAAATISVAPQPILTTNPEIHDTRSTPKPKILVVMPTYNRSQCIETVINDIKQQSYSEHTLLVIDDGSMQEHKNKFRQLRDAYASDKSIVFMEHIQNAHIANTLNTGIDYLLYNKNTYAFFTWVSDDNRYHPIFLEELALNNTFFKHSAYENKQNGRILSVNATQYSTFDDVLTKFSGCAAFMWTTDAVRKIGKYTENINGCEDYEYLLRTFKCKHAHNIITYSPNVLMTYVIHPDMSYLKNHVEIVALHANIVKIYAHFNNDNANLVYHSKTPYKVLFQRPQQMMRFYDKSANKCFIGKIDKCDFEDKYKLLIVPHCLNHVVYSAINAKSDTTIYYTDPRLYDEINMKHGRKLFDLIDAPIGEFAVWKPNLAKCVLNADNVIYSHPQLITFLNAIDTTRTYHYISNACDYEHFSRAKHRINARPANFPNTNKKILGYCGAFSEWLDYDLIRTYADKGEYHIVMIGGIPENPKYNIRFNHKNITWNDHKHYDELPYYLSWFDVCFLPFKNCELTKYVNPCKLWEYMASGKPIIKTNVNIQCDGTSPTTYSNTCAELYTLIAKDKYKYNYKIIRETDYDNNLSQLKCINAQLARRGCSTKINSKCPIIIFSMIDYYFRIQRNQHIARLLGEMGHTVFYLKTSLGKTQNAISKIGENLYEVSLYCKTDKHVSVYSTQLERPDVASVTDSIKELQNMFNFSYFISYITNPFWYQVVKYINNTGVIFDCIDFTKGFGTHNNIIIDDEMLMLKNEYVVFTSPVLRQMLGHDTQNFTFVRNACDFKYFNSMTTIKQHNSRKIIGYYGAISDWFDADLMAILIKQYPQCDFHLIGNVWCSDKRHEQKIRRLATFKNVVLMGEISYADLHLHVSKFDIGLIPFILNDLIKCTNPVKLYEMLSIGLPIVCTDMPDIKLLSKDELYYMSANYADFIHNIQKILDNSNNAIMPDKIQARIAYAATNTWEQRSRDIVSVIEHITPWVSIVMLCWNQWSHTKNCIESVINNTNYNNYELIIVNNGSEDETRDELEHYAKTYNTFIRVVNNDKNEGFARGMNIGALNASFDHIILLNNDTVVSKNWLYPLIKPLILDPNCTATSPITNNCGNEAKQFLHHTSVETLFTYAEKYQFNKMFATCKMDRIPFFCPAMKKHTFYAVGMLDERYKVGGWEDDDIMEKFKQMNANATMCRRVYGSFVYHIESLSMKCTTDADKNWTSQNKNQQIFEAKWGKKWIPPVYHLEQLSIRILTKNKYFLDLIQSSSYKNKHLYKITNNGITVGDNISNAIRLTDCTDAILLQHENHSFRLDKAKWNVFELYSILNVCIHCAK